MTARTPHSEDGVGAFSPRQIEISAPGGTLRSSVVVWSTHRKASSLEWSLTFRHSTHRSRSWFQHLQSRGSRNSMIIAQDANPLSIGAIPIGVLDDETNRIIGATIDKANADRRSNSDRRLSVCICFLTHSGRLLIQILSIAPRQAAKANR